MSVVDPERVKQGVMAEARERLERAQADALIARLEVEKWETFIREYH